MGNGVRIASVAGRLANYRVEDGATIENIGVVETHLDTGTETEVTLDEVVFSPEIQQEFFTARTLELRSKLRFLE